MKRIVFMGVGALGSTAAVLCRSLDAQLVLVDFDKVESKNLAAQAFVKTAMGKNKAQALASQLLNFWGLKAESFPVRVTADNVEQLAKGSDLIVDCFDNAASRRVLSTLVRARQAKKAKDIAEDDWNAATARNYAVTYKKDPYGPELLHGAMTAGGDFGLVRWDERFTADEEGQPGQPTCEGGEHLPFIGLLSGALAAVIQEWVQTGAKRDLMVTKGGIQTTYLEKAP